MTQEPTQPSLEAPPAEPKTPKVRSIKAGKKAKPKPPPRQRDQRPARYLPSDRIGFLKQLDILRAFAVASGPSGKAVTNNEVAALLKMQPSTVALTNAFFVENRFLQRMEGGSFLPAAEVVSFARTHEWNADTAAQKLAPIVAATWFGECLLPRLTMRPIEAEEALADLAVAARASTDYRAQLRTLLDYLAAAGLVLREGSLIRTGRGSAAAPEPPERPAATPPASEPREATLRPGISTSFMQQPTEGAIQFHVTVRVEMSEFAGWPADRIAAFFAGIAQVLAAKGAIERAASE